MVECGWGVTDRPVEVVGDQARQGAEWVRDEWGGRDYSAGIGGWEGARQAIGVAGAWSQAIGGAANASSSWVQDVSLARELGDVTGMARWASSQGLSSRWGSLRWPYPRSAAFGVGMSAGSAVAGEAAQGGREPSCMTPWSWTSCVASRRGSGSGGRDQSLRGGEGAGAAASLPTPSAPGGRALSRPARCWYRRDVPESVVGGRWSVIGGRASHCAAAASGIRPRLVPCPHPLDSRLSTLDRSGGWWPFDLRPSTFDRAGGRRPLNSRLSTLDRVGGGDRRCAG